MKTLTLIPPGEATPEMIELGKYVAKHDEISPELAAKIPDDIIGVVRYLEVFNEYKIYYYKLD